MAFTLNDGQGSLFRNTKKEEGSKQPDYQGECRIDGKTWRLAGWIRDGKEGKPKWLSLKVSEPRNGDGGERGGSDVPF